MVSMYRFLLQGTVHGVGLRYYILQVATRHKLVGTVRNVSDGVEIVVNDKDFMEKMTTLPSMIKITKHTVEKINSISMNYRDFRVVMSEY
jgi:hydrogenase maturation factor HypF (carbamoyltransferase family)